MRIVAIMFSAASLLFFVGCGAQPISSEKIDEIAFNEIPQRVGGYVNTAYGYQFDPVDGMEVWELTDQKTAARAGESATTVFLIEGEDNLFTVRGIQGARSAHEWLSQELIFFYPSGNAAQNFGELDGHEAIFLRGTGASDSPARLIVTQIGEQLVVISHDRESQQFDILLETFRFID